MLNSKQSFEKVKSIYCRSEGESKPLNCDIATPDRSYEAKNLTDIHIRRNVMRSDIKLHKMHSHSEDPEGLSYYGDTYLDMPLGKSGEEVICNIYRRRDDRDKLICGIKRNEKALDLIGSS